MKNFFGFAILNGINCPLTYEDGKATFYVGLNSIPLPEDGIKDFIAKDYSNTSYYFHLSTPIIHTGCITIDEKGKAIECIDFIYDAPIDFYIENFTTKSKYSFLEFEFPELDYFIPSNISIEDLHDFTYKGKKYCYFNEEFNYKNSIIRLTLCTNAFAHISTKTSFNMQTKSSLKISFDETMDLLFVVDLYKKVVDLFSFICNRRNISIESATLYNNGVLRCFDNFGEPFEDNKTIEKTLPFNYLGCEGLKNLFNLILNNEISINNIHPSEKRKHLIDLEYSLSVTSSFENYTRKWLPKISSDVTIECYEEAYKLIENYSKDFKGKRKKKFNKILKHLKDPEISLSDVIKKTYKGYKGWIGCKSFLSDYYEKNINELADNVGLWRNELAHNKNEYSPIKETIDGILLLDVMNYCLVLYKCELAEERIQSIIKYVYKINN